MRMTNEQFEAEVFRRSKVYMQERQVRRRRRTAFALAFAGCFAVVLLGSRMLSLTNKTSMMTADIAMDNAEGGMAAESSAEYAEEACDAEMADEADEGGDLSASYQAGEQSLSGNRSKQDAKTAGSVSACKSDTDYEKNDEDSCEESCAEESSEEEYSGADAQTGSLAELCAQFHISVPPEEIAGFSCNEIDDSQAGSYHCAFLNYEKADGSRLTVEISPRADADPEEIRYDISIVGGASALFGTGNARILMWVNDDAPDADALIHEAAEELKKAISP